MSTPVRFFQKDGIYHVYNRGNRKEDIFLDKKDFKRFLDKAVIYANKHYTEIFCYCLMPNHFHFLLRQNTDVPLSKFMLSLGTAYSKYFNTKYDQVGRLFQGRFKAKLVDTDEYLLQISRYIHLNPYGLVGKLEDYEWSSLSYYVRNRKLPYFSNVNPDFVLGYFSQDNPRSDYKKFVLEARGSESQIANNIKDLMIDL